eukprot:TRINITY_DN80023_c0_g1_i1.p1 TRINITY_DN80023_c0_g1~~TRINITY_DN80023_c0_g1_i1.p1  ORF type:complete len:491 (-),score=87.25 TRINITY_DN80023_c0_g1_i1:406-1878(-)
MVDVFLLTCVLGAALASCFALASVWRGHLADVQNGHASSGANARRCLRRLQLRYFAGYGAAVFSDWLQGAYFYAVYEGYGFSRPAIQALFVVGFGSSALLGTVVGSQADRFGRKAFCLVYFIVYSLDCLSLHVRSLAFLVIGRLMGGVATSLLFSTFDSWLVGAHNQAGLPADWLADTFRYAQLVNGLAAICAGFVAQAATSGARGAFDLWGLEIHWGGNVAPFEVSCCMLLSGFVLVACLWDENRGAAADATQERPQVAPGDDQALREKPGYNLLSSVRAGVQVVRSDARILALGVVSCLFEASMYCFVMQWTPALQAVADKPPLGYIFAAFMSGTMLGSQFFGFGQACRLPPELILLLNLCVAACSLAGAVALEGMQGRFACFLVFETCVGVYWPAISTLKGVIVPEDNRAAVYSLFRVPLNVLVLICLLTNLPVSTTLLVASVMLLLAAAACIYLVVALCRLRQRRQCSADALCGDAGGLESAVLAG